MRAPVPPPGTPQVLLAHLEGVMRYQNRLEDRVNRIEAEKEALNREVLVLRQAQRPSQIGPVEENYVGKVDAPGHIGQSLMFDNGVSVGLGTASPDPSVLFHMVSTTQGFIVPVMTEAERNAIAGGSPPEGLIIYNSTANALNVWNDTLGAWGLV